MTEAQQDTGTSGAPDRQPRRRKGKRPLLHVPAAIAAARLEAGKSPLELAQAAGITKGHLCHAEAGTVSLSAASLKAVADALGKPVRQFLNPEAVGPQVIALMSQGDDSKKAAGKEKAA